MSPPMLYGWVGVHTHHRVHVACRESSVSSMCDQQMCLFMDAHGLGSSWAHPCMLPARDSGNYRMGACMCQEDAAPFRVIHTEQEMQKVTAGVVDDEVYVNLQCVLAASASCMESRNVDLSLSRERVILFYLALARQHWDSSVGTGTGTKKALTYWGESSRGVPFGSVVGAQDMAGQAER